TRSWFGADSSRQAGAAPVRGTTLLSAATGFPIRQTTKPGRGRHVTRYLRHESSTAWETLLTNAWFVVVRGSRRATTSSKPRYALCCCCHEQQRYGDAGDPIPTGRGPVQDRVQLPYRHVHHDHCHDHIPQPSQPCSPVVHVRLRTYR